MRLELSHFIESDLDDIADYIAQDNPNRAVTFIQDIRAKFHNIHHNPLHYQLRPDIGNEARMATVGSYAILFRVTGEVVRIERVAYGGSRPPGYLRSAATRLTLRWATLRRSCLKSLI